jgi:hypothetical protein
MEPKECSVYCPNSDAYMNRHGGIVHRQETSLQGRSVSAVLL